jgi:F-type H+-transporting ATPase subunit b
MGFRKLTVAALLIVAALAVHAPAAHAADPGTEEGKELVECVEKALDDNAENIENDDFTSFRTDLDDCHAAKSLLLPVWSEVLWSAIAFAVVLFLLMKYGFPSVKRALANREAKIRTDLESASRAREEAEAEAAQYRAQIADARTEGNAIIDDARADAERIRRELVARAEADAAEVRERAQEDIRLAQERAMADLRLQVADLSIELAEKVVERNLDPETQRALIDSYIAQVGSN